MISFEMSDEQRMIKDMATDFAANEFRPKAHECDEKDEIPAEVFQKAWELGMVNSSIPENYGGTGMARSSVSGAVMSEELAYGDLSMAMGVLAPALFLYPIMEFGTEEQKSKFLPMFAGGNFVKATAAVVEPAVDFDLAALTTTAQKKSGGYVLNGRKCFVPLGAQADHIIVYAAGEKPGHENVCGYIVEKGAKGLTVAGREHNMGLKALETAELTLENVEVPVAARLGGEQGCDFAKLMNYSRVALSAMATGMARASFDYARQYAKERVAFGEPIAHRQVIAFMLAEMAIEVDATRCLVWEAAWRLDKNLDSLRESYLAKLYADQMVMKVCDYGVQILGGHGYIREHPVELWFRNARGFAAFEGMATV